MGLPVCHRGRYLIISTWVPSYRYLLFYVESIRQLAVDIIQGYLGYSSAGLRRLVRCWLSTSRKIAEASG